MYDFRQRDMEDFANTSGLVSVGDAVLRYVVEGSGHRVLVVGSATYYPRTFSPRLRESCRLAFADLRHFACRGSASPSVGMTLDTYASDIEAVRQALGWEAMNVVGHSHHGNVALHYARRYPQRVPGVVMIGSPPVGVRETIEAGAVYWSEHASAERKMILRRNHEALREIQERTPAGDAFVAQYIADAPKYWYDPHYNAAWLWKGVEVHSDVIRQLREQFANYRVIDEAQQLAMPLLVVVGRHDYVVPHFLWDSVRLSLPNLTYEVFERSGHTPQLEDPEIFDSVFLRWLRAFGGKLSAELLPAQ